MVRNYVGWYIREEASENEGVISRCRHAIKGLPFTQHLPQ